jgi:hypothetical protein
VFSGLFSVQGLVRGFAGVPLWAAPLLLLLLHYGMVFRGLLFMALDSSSARQREWRARVQR